MEENNSHGSSKEKSPKKIDYKKYKWYSKSSPTSDKKQSRKPKTESKSPKSKNADSKVYKKRKYLSPSAKLESKIPKVADLLKAKEEREKLIKIDNLIKKTSKDFLNHLKDDPLTISEKPKVKDLNCKHLTLKYLERRFRKDVEFVDGVFNGTIYSERHELFHNQVDGKAQSLKEDLRLSESVGAFKSEQLIYIISLFRERYDDTNKYKYSDYYFKVLLPEYCLKIFMDCHRLNKTKALEYLEKVPIPVDFEKS